MIDEKAIEGTVVYPLMEMSKAVAYCRDPTRIAAIVKDGVFDGLLIEYRDTMVRRGMVYETLKTIIIK